MSLIKSRTPVASLKPPQIVPPTPGDDAWLALIAQKVRGLRYGSIEIVVHDTKVVQVEVHERRRFAPGQGH